MNGTAIILAGGRSSRFGEDKCFLTWKNKKFLIQHQIDNLKFLNQIIIAGNKGKFSFLPYMTVEDQLKNIGAIEGLRQGLKNSYSLYNFLISCDMPFINRKLIEYMFSVSSGYDAVICKNGDYVEPTYGIYSKSLISLIEQNISKGMFSFRDVIYSCNVLFIPQEIVENYSPTLSVFFNINTKEDLLKLPFII